MPCIWGRYLNPALTVMIRPIITRWIVAWETMKRLSRLSAVLHQKNIRLILDGVFNHVGRDFWAFRDVLKSGRQSAYCGWFQGLDFHKHSPYNDPFTYEAWNGHHNLVKLNLSNPAVKDHLFQAVDMWIREFAIDGLRLDVADCLDLHFSKGVIGLL